MAAEPYQNGHASYLLCIHIHTWQLHFPQFTELQSSNKENTAAVAEGLNRDINPSGKSKLAHLYHLTFAVSVEIEDTARSHHCFQGDDLIERHAE